MANNRQCNRRNYHEIPGSIISETSFVEGSAADSGGRGFIPPPIHLQRELPSYNDAASAGRTAILNDPGTVLSDSADNDYPGLSTLEEIVIEGYEHVTYESTLISPPPWTAPRESRSPSHRGVESIPNLDDATVRDVILSYVAQNLCWGLKAAKEMKINDIVPISAFHYSLETCTETRSAAWVHEPFTGQLIDSSDRGRPPKPWDVLVVPPNPFREGQVIVEVPHSARIVNCHDCSTLGRRRCWSCFGNGEIRCSACNGTGQPSNNQTPAEPTTALGRVCIQCTGAGRRRCVVCLGPGQLPCKTCLARAAITRCSRKLPFTLQPKIGHQITRKKNGKIHKVDRVVERTALPENLIRSVSGRVAFEEESAFLWPINFFPDEAVNHASRELLEEHRVGFQSEKIMAQKQFVRLVPIYQISYEWQKNRGTFYIYGYENHIFFPDYPQKTCCGILDLWPFSLCRF